MNWGKSIILAFVLFAVFIGVLVFVCVRQDINLVSKDYYQEELAYQQQIDRLNNTRGLEAKPVMNVRGNVLEIQFNQFGNMEQGELKLFRPSDVRFDKLFTLQSSAETLQRLDVSALPRGMYRAKMKWSMKGKEYFFEDVISL
jgi:hypothetical protein